MWSNTLLDKLLPSIPLFARLLGFFALSPLFANRALPSSLRIGFALLFTLLLFPSIQTAPHPSVFLIVRELIFGYLLGFLFALIFEGASLAGQLVGTLSGFSATELFDPQANSKDPLISKLFSLTLFSVFLAMDGHHVLLRFLYESFSLMPLQSTPQTGLYEIALASTSLFRHAIELALIPLTFLGAVLVTFALSSRFFPHLQIFWIGFPLQLLVSFLAIGITLTLFPEAIKSFVNESLQVAKRIFFSF